MRRYISKQRDILLTIMNKIIAIFFIISLLVGCSMNPTKSLIGKWKSNEQKTLASVEATKGVSEKAKLLFNKDFFGKLIVEYKKDTYRAWYENKEATEGPEPYKLLEATDKYYIVEAIDLLSGKKVPKQMFWDNECYYLLVSKWKFREYFCKVE